MKKYIFALVVALLSAFILASCGADDASETVSEAAEEAAGHLIVDDFLADVDYMMHVLENNFPFFHTAYWARGVDIYQFAENARTDILNTENITEDDFLAILSSNFMPAFSIGHFTIFHPFTYYMWLNGFNGGTLAGDDAFRRFLRSPDVYRFYGSRVLDFREQAMTTVVSEMEFSILEDGHIAYMSLSRMHVPENPERIFDFYREIEGFGHLIIDIRGNPGGNWQVLDNYIIGPNITEVLRGEIVAFRMDGEYISRYDEFNIRMGIRPLSPAMGTDIFTTVDEFLAENYLPQLNQHDIDRMAYVFTGRYSVVPRLSQFDGQPAFDGKIWLLVDEGVGSAAETTAWLMKDADFATLVGEITGGNFGGMRTFSAMPNTGIVFIFDAYYLADRYGRPLEAGTIPHHFNRAGMDALETTLEIIAEGN